MQCIRRCWQSVLTGCSFSSNPTNLTRFSIPGANFHTSSKLSDLEEEKKEGPSKWLTYNEKIYPPQELSEKPRPAFVCHMKTNIKYSPKTMWYVSVLVRGLSVDEAIKQLSHCLKKGAVAAKETILEAQKMAVEQHNVEFKSNLWVAESFVGKGKVVKGIRKHAKGRMGRISYRYVHYFVRLEEGQPPKHYFGPEPKTKDQLLEDWITKQRERKIANSI
ncbi:hypothetical protein HCN44_011005 [Aphidius gifuensis]|uniref:Large ribosomal subunit protein uL22m n=1 Tax=Aphidius gifuensis TaxID=684658 RepID=A0A835CWK2_APHGI|nr:39S ribosomal protein L22, mitochondrial [Aphidius gifuensis]KAF7998597.1 hypothetical protein HCN44_011005 [Aphidius gifuensis]